MRILLKKYCIIIILIFFIFGCGRPSLEDINPQTSVDIIPDQETWDFHFLLSNGGILQAEVKAGHMQRFNEVGLYELNQSVIVDFFDKDGKLSSTLFSDSGSVDENNNFMTVNGNVRGVSKDRVLLFSDELKWSKEQKKIYTDKFVKIFSKGDTVYGYGFESTQEFKKWKIFKPFGITDRKIAF